MTATTLPKLLRPHVFAKALADAGVIHDEQTIRRIVIDINADDAVVVMHIERWGDERLLDVSRTLDGIEIHELSRQQDESPAEPANKEE
jgi:hypothetical protein